MKKTRNCRIGLTHRRDWMNPEAVAWTIYVRGRFVAGGYSRDWWSFDPMPINYHRLGVA